MRKNQKLVVGLLLAFAFVASPAFAWTITASAGANGAISPTGAVSVANGASQAFSITPDATYRVLDVLVDGYSAGAVISYPFTNVLANHSIYATFDNHFTITASSGANGTVTPSGVTTLVYGESQTYTIKPDAGCQVASLIVDGTPVTPVIPAGMSRTFTNVTADHTIVAFFVQTWTITASAGANGAISPTGAIVVINGYNQIFTIAPNLGYHVDDVLMDGVSQGPLTSYPFTNVLANHTIAASFAINTYTITPTAGANGAINPNTPQMKDYGGSQTFTITPNAGYVSRVRIDGIECAECSSGIPKNYIFTHIATDHTIDVTFVFPHTITASAGLHGTISPTGVVTVGEGANRVFLITPEAGYSVETLIVDGAPVTPVNAAGMSYTFSNVTANHTIAATFSNTFTITATSGANGTVTPSGVTTKINGDNQIYTITPDAGYQIATLTVDGVLVAVTTPTVGMTYTFTNVTANHTITAMFGFTYTITASAGANGTISPTDVVPVAAGANQWFTITPSPGYHVNDVLVDGYSEGAVYSYPFTNVSANHTISATFAISTYTYMIWASAGANGAISPTGDVSVGAGTNQTFTITPNLGYHVDDVLVDGVSQGPLTSYPFTNVVANHTIAASFAINTYTITPTAGANGAINPNTPQAVNYDGSQTFTITPNATYVSRVLIDGVEDTTMARGTPKNYIFTHVSANHTIAATFDAGTPVITPVIGPRSTTAQTRLSFQVSATDPGNHDVTWSLDAPSIAKGMTIGQGAGVDRMKGNFSWTPTRDQIGNHTVRFTVQDAGGNSAFEDVVITVTCSPASIVPPTSPRTLVAGMSNTFLVTGASLDTADVNFIVTGDTTTQCRLPIGASLTNQSNPGVDRMKVEFAWSPLVSQVGTYTVRFTAADSCAWVGAAPNTPRDTVFSTPVILNVILGNPVITVPSGSATYSISTRATDTLTASKFGLRLYATNPVPGGDIQWTIDPAFPAPAWATLTDSLGASLGASYHGVPACANAGVDTVGFIATDPVGVGSGALSDTIKVIITVLPGNPVAGVLGSHDTLDVMTTTPLNYTLSATDPNTPDSVTWSVPTADTLGTGLVLTNNANWSGHFAWTPGPLQAGVHQFHFMATDNWGCADTELVTIVVSSTRMLSVAFDTIPKVKIDVPLLKFKIGLDGYTLTSLKIRSKIEKEFAISKLSLWRNNAALPFATSALSGRFDENYEKTLTGFSVPLDSDDTITVKVDTWPDSVDTDTTYQMTGLELVIPPNGMVFQRPSLPDATLFPYFICNTLAIDSLTGEWKGTPNYRVRFDLYGPHFTVDVTDLDACTETNYIHIGSKLAFHIYGLNEKIPDSTITVNLSAFGRPSSYMLKKDRYNPATGFGHFHNPNWNSSIAYLTQEWYDTVTVIDDNLDFDTGYKITFVAKDKYLNEGKNDYVFSRRIDTIRPKVDSLKLFLSQNNVGDSSATIGDELTLIAYLGSSGYFEVKSVSADLSRFGEPVLALDDITNGNNVWRGKFILKNAIGVDIPWGADSLRKSAIITATDSACNVAVDTAYLRNALDLRATCGDADGSAQIDVADAVYLVSYIFSGGPAPNPLAAGDADCSLEVDVADAVYLVNYIFSGGAAPCAACPK